MRYGRASRTTDGNLVVPMWLIFDRTGSVRLTRTEPSVGRSERAMLLTATVPLTLFDTPTISATLTIDAPVMSVPQIDVTAAAEALKGALGCDIDVRVSCDSGRPPEGGDSEAAPGAAGQSGGSESERIAQGPSR